MTVCNMSIEGGARAGMIAPDQTTFDYLKTKEHVPQGADWDKAIEKWSALTTDPGAQYDQSFQFGAEQIAPQVTWGTNPGQVISIDTPVPDPAEFLDAVDRKAAEDSLRYMDLKSGTKLTEVPIDRVFIGSCTNARIEDLRQAAAVCRGYRIADGVNAMVVPGSGIVKKEAEAEGLDKVFLESGFEWREPGCSMCLAMNPDRLEPGQRCASTSNRNFEGRQGRGGRTHLVSPAMAAAAGIAGKFVDIREWNYKS